jgi:hypothetical protein
VLAEPAGLNRIAHEYARPPAPSIPGRHAGVRIAITFVLMLLAPMAHAVMFDRIAAVVDNQVIAVSEITQMLEIRFFPRAISGSADDYRHDILESLIAQALRFRDVERFGAQEIPKDSIESRVSEIVKRFGSPAEFDAALRSAELTPDELRALVKRQLQVEAYIQERFAPLVFISNEEIQNYYNTTWSEQRRSRGLPIPPIAGVREEIRTLLKSSRLQEEIDKWTAELRARANVDVFAWR